MSDYDFDAAEKKLRAATMTHEELADLFFNTMVGQMSNVTRDEFLARLRANMPTQEALSAWQRASYGTMQTYFALARAQAHGKAH